MTIEKKEHKNRTKYLIYPKFQLTLIFANLFIMLCNFAIVGVQSFRSIEYFKKLGLNEKLPLSHSYFTFLNYQGETMMNYMVAGFIMSAVFSCLVTLFITHKMAGPLVRLLGEMRNISNSGKYRAIKFRKDDYLVELPEAISDAFAIVANKNEKVIRPKNFKKAA